MNDFVWTLALLLGYIILSLLGRKKKRPANSKVLSPVNQALQQLLDFQRDSAEDANTAQYPATAEPQPLSVASEPKHAVSTALPPLKPRARRAGLGRNLRDPGFARRSFVLSEVFGAPRAMRPPLYRTGLDRR